MSDLKGQTMLARCPRLLALVRTGSPNPAPEGRPAPAHNATAYTYDPVGNRLTSAVTTSGTTTTTGFSWDPNTCNPDLPDLVDETLPDATTRATSWLTPSVTRTKTGNTTLRDYQLTDPQHSVDTLISPARTTTATYSYLPFGTGQAEIMGESR